jgi:hypothetical protein
LLLVLTGILVESVRKYSKYCRFGIIEPRAGRAIRRFVASVPGLVSTASDHVGVTFGNHCNFSVRSIQVKAWLIEVCRTPIRRNRRRMLGLWPNMKCGKKLRLDPLRVHIDHAASGKLVNKERTRVGWVFQLCRVHSRSFGLYDSSSIATRRPIVMKTNEAFIYVMKCS